MSMVSTNVRGVGGVKVPEEVRKEIVGKTVVVVAVREVNSERR